MRCTCSILVRSAASDENKSPYKTTTLATYLLSTPRFNMEIGQDRALTPNGFIYLKASPETCFKRLQHRARSEEVGVDPGYLGSLHQKHEDWLHFGARALHEVVEAQRQMLESVTRAHQWWWGGVCGGARGAGRRSCLEEQGTPT